MNDQLRAWLAPLIEEADKRNLDLSGEILTANNPDLANNPTPGKINQPMNWELFGRLVIERLGWQDSYPAEPQPLKID